MPDARGVGAGAAAQVPRAIEGELVRRAEKPLSPAEKVAAKHLQRFREKAQQRAYRIVADAMAASEIDDETPRPEGWTARKHRTALDARSAKRNAPAYLDMAARIVETTERAKDDATPRELNLTVINLGAPRQYPEMALDEKERT